MAALAIKARSCLKPANKDGFGRDATGAGGSAFSRVVSILHAGVSYHFSASCCTAARSLKSEFVILERMFCFVLCVSWRRVSTRRSCEGEEH